VAVALGVDVAEARKGLDVVALDDGRRVIDVLRRATPTDVRRLADELDPAVVCIDSPPAWATSGRSRTAERALRPIGVSAYSTPTDPGDHPFYRWMRAGFAVFDAVAERYPRYLGGEVHGTAAEVFPEATAVLLAGHLRAKDDPKPVFRRRVLDAHGVDHAALRSVDAVDAALAALTGVLALEGECTAIGDPTEGVILLPVRTLPAARLERRASTIAPRPAASLGGVCLDCGPDHFAAMVRLYGRLLGRSVAAGCADPATCTHDGDHWAHLPDSGGGATINVQSETWYEPPVWPERPGHPSKMAHLELAVTDVGEAVAVALAAGATEAAPQPADRDPDRLRVMLDPAGHPFCLCRD
jgi:predicted nuclease with RNAse H fold